MSTVANFGKSAKIWSQSFAELNAKKHFKIFFSSKLSIKLVLFVQICGKNKKKFQKKIAFFN